MILNTSDELPVLTHLERVGPKGWLRYVFPFELPDNYDIDEVSRVLRVGYDAAAERLPVMACEAVPDTEAKQAGQLKLKKIPGDIDLLIIKDLRDDADAFPHSFAELKAKSFPVAALPAATLCPRPVWPRPGERLPVSLAQANFVRGGLVLAWNLFHMFGDSVTYSVWAQVWAEECRRAQGVAVPDPVVLPGRVFTDRARVMGPPSLGEIVRVEDHPEYILLPFTPKGMPPKMMLDTHRGQVFYFSPEKLAALKEEASPPNATKNKKTSASSTNGGASCCNGDDDETVPAWISTNDAVSALLWRTVMAVQNPIESLPVGDAAADPVSAFAIAIDARRRTDPPVHPKALGCFLAYVGVEMPIRAMLTGPLADVAVAIRRAVARAGSRAYTDEVVALVHGLEDLDRLVVKAFTDVPGYHCVQTSWTNFDVYNLNWGPALGHKIQSMRCPDVGLINGLQVVLPATPDGGLEVLVGVEQSCLAKLMHEPLWTKYAEAR